MPIRLLFPVIVGSLLSACSLALKHQQRLAGEIVEIFQHRKSLADSLYDRGLTDTRGLFTARQNLRNAQAELPQIEALLADAEGRLWVLLGGYRADLADLLPDSLTSSTALEPVPAGIPSLGTAA